MCRLFYTPGSHAAAHWLGYEDPGGTEIEVKFKNRRCSIDAIVLPGDNEPLPGAIPMEDMDILIHPLRQELIVNPDHPYFAQMKMK